MSFIDDTLKKVGLKNTKARVFIIKSLEETSKPISAEEIFRKNKKIDIATIYRNLQTFEKIGLLRKVDLRKESVYYELTGVCHHHHIVCNDCGEVEDFSVKGEELILAEALKKSKKFTLATDHSLEIFGICKTCLK